MSDVAPKSTKASAAEAFAIAASEYDADLYFYSGEIDDDGLGKLVTAITENKSRKNALLILVTNGGSANAAYQIARFFQKTYYDGKFILFTPSYCKSAGTLIALGANVLIMDMFSELGPLDVQLLKTDEIATRKSGLISRSSFQALEEASFNLFENFMLEIKRRSNDAISFRLAAKVSAKVTAELMAKIYEQINPDIIGGDYRDLQVALHYGVRLVGYSGNASPEAVMHLVEHYPAHDFIIDEEEAAGLFNTVDHPTTSLYDVIGFLGNFAYNEGDGVVMALKENSDQENSNDDANQGDKAAKPATGRPSGMDDDRENDRASHSEASRDSATGGQSLHTSSEEGAPPIP